MGVHDGHRERMKSRFVEAGLEGFNDHNALEMLLFYAVPRKDTNELAHRLLKHFGSLAGVFEASYEELLQVDGIGENTATLLKLVPAVSQRYLMTKYLPEKTVKSSSDAGKYFVARFMYEVNEMAYALLLNSSNGVIACKQISSGIVNATEISIRMLVEIALKNNAAGVIIAHNHPGAQPFPSKEDEHSTELIRKALDLVDIKLLDHIIVGGKDYRSLTKMGVM